jgi:hypothetical protein
MRGLSLLISLGLVFVACSSDPEPDAEPECTPNQFRACPTETGVQGHQQCLEQAVWSPCIASVYNDASYADHGQPDATAETSDGDALDALDALDAGETDASEDAGDAPEASLLD